MMFVCLFVCLFSCLLMHEFSDFGGGDNERRRLPGRNTGQRNVTPLSSW